MSTGSDSPELYSLSLLKKAIIQDQRSNLSDAKADSNGPIMLGKRRVNDFRYHPLHFAIYSSEKVEDIKSQNWSNIINEQMDQIIKLQQLQSESQKQKIKSESDESEQLQQEFDDIHIINNTNDDQNFNFHDFLNSECFLPPYRHGIESYEKVAESASPFNLTPRSATGTPRDKTQQTPRETTPSKYMFSLLALIFVLPRFVRSVRMAMKNEPDNQLREWQEFIEIWHGENQDRVLSVCIQYLEMLFEMDNKVESKFGTAKGLMVLKLRVNYSPFLSRLIQDYNSGMMFSSKTSTALLDDQNIVLGEKLVELIRLRLDNNGEKCQIVEDLDTILKDLKWRKENYIWI